MPTDRILQVGRRPALPEEERPGTTQLMNVNYEGEAFLSSVQSTREAVRLHGRILCILAQGLTGIAPGEVVAIIEWQNENLAVITHTHWGPAPFGRALEAALVTIGQS